MFKVKIDWLNNVIWVVSPAHQFPLMRNRKRMSLTTCRGALQKERQAQAAQVGPHFIGNLRFKCTYCGLSLYNNETRLISFSQYNTIHVFMRLRLNLLYCMKWKCWEKSKFKYYFSLRQWRWQRLASSLIRSSMSISFHWLGCTLGILPAHRSLNCFLYPMYRHDTAASPLCCYTLASNATISLSWWRLPGKMATSQLQVLWQSLWNVWAESEVRQLLRGSGHHEKFLH